MSSWKKKLIFGAMIAAIGLLLVLVPQTRFLEQEIGLPILFKLRGQKAPPSDVLIVTLDKDSAEQFQLPPEPDTWPRSLHAELVDHLMTHNVQAIAFDLHFHRSRSRQNDRIFARALQRAGRVVLCECLKTEKVQAGMYTAQIERPDPPVQILQQNAAAVAPFPLPKVPVKVAQYWTFKTSAGEKPTLPVTAFQVFALEYYEHLRALLKDVSPDLVRELPANSSDILSAGNLLPTVRDLRELFNRHPSLAPKMLKELSRSQRFSNDEHGRRILNSLIKMYQSPENLFLNYYGPPGTIETVPYYRVLQGNQSLAQGHKPTQLQGKAVFVGLSTNLRPEQQDGFYTVFSQSSGVDISGVEIAATAFANILEDNHVQPLPVAWILVLVAAWSFVCALLCWPLNTLRSAAGGGALCAVYTIGAQQAFASNALWLPLIIPVCIQFPLALSWGILWTFRETHREKQSFSKALGRYLPPDMVDRLAKEKHEEGTTAQIVHGTCLITDAGQYTTLSEQMSPQELNAFMKRYYETLFRPIKEQRGTVINIIGDSMLAVWTSASPDMSIKRKACLAALNIPSSAEGLHPAFPHVSLTTRIGMHSGEIFLGDVGAMDHYEYRPSGDIVNTASRLEGLNKLLGTRVLVSEAVLSQVDDFLVRELGVFLLAGKSKPIAVFELLCLLEAADQQLKEFCEIFQAGVEAFKQQSFSKATELFSKAQHACPGDGPSQFYSAFCKEYEQNMPDDNWDGVICIESK
ncbi:MAG: adenylate/guanylate cyclase domain-containing protein [Desulfovermiculus sp.]|nr:adenylate/guanylate cyclase domain-containing protein [Desulfovermiculus sp.]